MNTLDRLLRRRDALGLPGETVIDRYRQRQSGALPPPSDRPMFNNRQREQYEKAERERLARRRRSENL
jgi:hypothetical protein